MRDQLAETVISIDAYMVADVDNADERLLEELYDAYSIPLFRYALMLTSSRDDAEDVVQTVFIRVAREWKRLTRIQNIKAYLFSATRNAAFNVIRGKQRRDNMRESLSAALCIEQEASAIGDRIEFQTLCEALEELPVDQREVLVLKIFDEMTFKEIADTIGTSVNTVASRYRYGIEKLRKALQVDDDE